jgi:hypothetical protein
MAPSKKVRELFGPPTNASDNFPFEFPKPNPELVKLAILTLHAQVKAAREKEAAKKGKATPRPRHGEAPSSCERGRFQKSLARKQSQWIGIKSRQSFVIIRGLN